MLAFERVSAEINDEVLFDPRHLILAGWSGRDEASVRQHMAELAEHGVPPPSTFPLFYRVSASLASQVSRLEVLGPVDGRWLLRAADHQTLCAALAATPRPSGRVRIEVDPLRV